MSTNKAKIAIFHNLPSGGAKRYIYEISRLLKNKYEIHEYKLSTASGYLNLKQHSAKTKSYIYYPGKNIFQFIFNAIFLLPKVERSMANEINNSNFKCVIVNHDFITKSPYLLKYLKIPSIYICHEPQREFYEDPSFHSPSIKDKISNLLRYPIKLIDRFNVTKASILVSNSKYSKKVLYKVYNLKSKVIYPGVNSSFFKPSPRPKNHVISVGGFLPIKGHAFSIKSISLINKETRPKFVIVGDGRAKDKQVLVNLAKKNQVRVKFISKPTDEQLLELYNRSYCLLSSSYSEPFGLSLIEAMSCGIPVVAIKSGGVGEQIIDGKTGFYISKRNTQDFAEKIEIAIRERNILGRNGRDYVVRKWQWQAAAEKFEKIINSV